MTISVYTVIQKQGIAEGHPEKGMMEYGYGQYVNAYVKDSDFDMSELGANASMMGLYATERVPFDADQKRITKARKLARDRARQRYLRERASV